MSNRRSEGYKIEQLDETEYATLIWLAARGYDAGILKAAGVEEEFDRGGAVLGTISEPDAREINEAVAEDPSAFLACCGSPSLARKLNRFLDAIV